MARRRCEVLFCAPLALSKDVFPEIVGSYDSPINLDQTDPLDPSRYPATVDNFFLEVKTQLNKDIRNPLHPASFEHPQISLKVLLGRRSEDGRMGIAVYQPQLLRIMKTVELIGLYNEFD